MSKRSGGLAIVSRKNRDVPDVRSSSSTRSAPGVKWYHRLSFKLALALGLTMFSIQFLASTLIIQTYKSSLEDMDTTTRSASSPFARYLRDHLEQNGDGQWVPTADATNVLNTFLSLGETYVWLDPEDRVLMGGRAAMEYTHVGAKWSLCDSSEYCEVLLGEKKLKAGSTWTQLALGGRHIGTFVLVWFDYPGVASLLSERQVQVDLLSRLLASGVVAALTSVLLVSLVTRRLSRLATDASTPLDEKLENVDLPGPFDSSGKDEIARLATALNTMRGRIEDLVARLEDAVPLANQIGRASCRERV